MIRFLCPLVCLALIGCGSTGPRGRESVTGPVTPSLQTAADRSEGPGRNDAEIRALLQQEEFGLRELLRIAEINSHAVQSARNDVGAAAGRLWQRELYPNPTLEFEAEDIPSSDLGLTHSENKIAMVQPLIVGRRRSHAISAAAAEYDKHQYLVRHTVRRIQGEVRTCYVGLVYLNQAIALHAELHQIAQQTFQIANVRFGAQAAPESERLKAQIDVRELELAARRLRRQRMSDAAQLQLLLGGVQVPVERLRGQLRTNLPALKRERLRTAVREQHPAVLAAWKEVEAADQRLAQTQAERIPDTNIRLAYGRNAATDENIAEAGIGFPLPLFDRDQGHIVESRHLAEKARHEMDLLVNALQTELTALFAAYDTARDEVTTFQEQIVPSAEKAFAQAHAGYQAGKTGLLDLLDAQRTLVKVRRSALESLKDMNGAWALLWKIAGAELEKHPDPGET